MKKFLIAMLFVGAGLSIAKSGDPVSFMAWPNSKYDIEQSTFQVSSMTVATVSPVSTYRATYIWNTSGSATIYYRIDGSTAAIPTVGWPILPNEKAKIETDAAISIMLAPAVAVYDARKLIFKK